MIHDIKSQPYQVIVKLLCVFASAVVKEAKCRLNN